MKGVWQVQEAKNRFSEVVERALSEGPQTVTRRGREAVVVLSVSEYRRLSRPQESFKRFLRRAPLRGVVVERVKDPGRRVELP